MNLQGTIRLRPKTAELLSEIQKKLLKEQIEKSNFKLKDVSCSTLVDTAVKAYYDIVFPERGDN